MKSIPEEQEREAFHAEMRRRNVPVTRIKGGGYKWLSANSAWSIWQARASQLYTHPTQAAPVQPSDEQIIALNAGERFFSESPTKYAEAGHGTQYHAGAPGVIGFARAVLALAPSGREAIGNEAIDAVFTKHHFIGTASVHRALARDILALAAPQAAEARKPQDDEEPSKKQKKLLELAERIDYEELWRWAGMDHDKMTSAQRDRMNAGVELRRYATLWKADRWIVIPPVGPVRFSADTLDKAVEMAKRDEARKTGSQP